MTKVIGFICKQLFPALCILLLSNLSPAAQDDINELYVINAMAETLDKIDLISGAVEHNVAVLGLYPNRLFVNDTMAVVVNSGDANLQLIRLADYSTIGYVYFDENDNPYDIAVVGDTAAYVSLFGSHEVAWCNLVARTVVSQVSVGHYPEGIILHGDRVYVVNTGFDGIEFVFKQGTLYVIDRPTFTVADSVYTSRNPQSLAAVGDGTIHIVCTGNYVDEFGRVDVLDPATLTIVDHIEIGGSPGIIHVSRQNQAYLADWGWTVGYVYKYNTITRAVLNNSSNPISPGNECAYVIGDMSDNLYVCEFNVDNITELESSDTPTGRNFAVGDGPAAAGLRTNRLPGDIDENRTVNPIDVVYAVNFVYKNYDLPGRSSAADVNGDCVVNPVDVVILVNRVYRNYGALLWGCAPNP